MNFVQSLLQAFFGHLGKVSVINVLLDLNRAVFVEKLVKLKSSESLSPLDFLAVYFDGGLIFPELESTTLSNDLVVGLLVSLVVEIADIQVFGELVGQVEAIDC